MAPPPPAKSYPLQLQGLIVATTVAFIFFLTLLPPKSGAPRESGLDIEESKKVIGSKPPACVNKCMKCMPCMATLVVPSHKGNKGTFKPFSSPGRRDGEDDTYYLLSWKCKCGNKLFHP